MKDNNFPVALLATTVSICIFAYCLFNIFWYSSQIGRHGWNKKYNMNQISVYDTKNKLVLSIVMTVFWVVVLIGISILIYATNWYTVL